MCVFDHYIESNQEFDSYLYYVQPVSVSSGNSVSNISAGTTGGSSAMVLNNFHGSTLLKQMSHHSTVNPSVINSKLNINQQHAQLTQQQPTQHQQTQPQQQQQQQHSTTINQSNNSTLIQQQQRPTNSESLQSNEPIVHINPNTSENSEVPLIIVDENAPPQPGPTIAIAHVIKSILKYLAQYVSQPLWSYEDITAKGMLYIIILLFNDSIFDFKMEYLFVCFV